jgi:hypothetical protein
VYKQSPILSSVVKIQNPSRSLRTPTLTYAVYWCWILKALLTSRSVKWFSWKVKEDEDRNKRKENFIYEAFIIHRSCVREEAGSVLRFLQARQVSRTHNLSKWKSCLLLSLCMLYHNMLLWKMIWASDSGVVYTYHTAVLSLLIGGLVRWKKHSGWVDVAAFSAILLTYL